MCAEQTMPLRRATYVSPRELRAFWVGFGCGLFVLVMWIIGPKLPVARWVDDAYWFVLGWWQFFGG